MSDSYDPVFSTADNRYRWTECCQAAARRLVKRFHLAVDVFDLADAMAEAAHEIYVAEQREYEAETHK